MLTLLLILPSLAFVGGLFIGRRPVHKVRHELTETIADLRDKLGTAIKQVRWVPMKRPELAKFAKTGCGTCHGAGGVEKPGTLTEKPTFEVCRCVFKAIANRVDYGATENGVPVRLATIEELEAYEKHEKKGNVIPIGAAR